MTNTFKILLLSLLICNGLLAQPLEIIQFGSSWSYYDDGDEPSGSWEGITYDDSNWDTGNGQLGYGDGDENTVLKSTDAMGGNLSAAYFRREFTIANVASISSFSLDFIYDDGVIIYINGTEIIRRRMQSGNVTYGSYTQSQSQENELYTFVPAASSFVDGTNVIAVEVHQRSNNSSDISFDLRLRAVQEYLNFGSSWNYYDAGDKPADDISGNSWPDAAFDDNNWKNDIAEFGWGDGDEATVVSNVNTVYFRTSAYIMDVAQYMNYVFNVKYDDGYALYVNGAEVKRNNIDPCCTLLYSTAASSHIGENAMSRDTIDASFFNSGMNTIAFEIHDGSKLDLSFDLELIPGQLGPSEVIRGPYLQKGTSNSMVIKWRTDRPVESKVNYGTTQGNLSMTATDPTLKTDHEIEITGLNDATVYYYSISDESAVIVPSANDLYFKTHPIPGTDVPTRAWILGDAGTANNNQRAVRDAYYNYTGTEHTDMILFLGDNAYNDGTDAQYQNAVFENMYEDKLKNTISWSTIGNHDGYTADSDTQTGPYYEIFTFPKAGESGGLASGTEAYYSFDYGDVHYIILDSNDSPLNVGGAMYNWAKMDIQNTQSRWIVALFHHPPYTKGSHNSDFDGDSGGRMRDMRKNFLPMLEDNGIDLVLSGHSHSYERSFFINGHYDKSPTFDASTHFVANGDGDGKSDSDGAYRKDICNPDAGDGSVYITTGSAGKITGSGKLDHPAMFYSRKDLGSTVLEVHGDTLNVKFIRNNNNIDDYFTILKTDIVANVACDDGLACTINDVYDANCDCAGTEVDTDGDNTSDCNDACPNDPNKILPGTCGCGISDADTDMDGVKDCVDQCPNDPLRTVNDACGCGSPSIDTDADGICDDIDDCVLLLNVNPFGSADTTYEAIETIISDALLNGGSNMNFSAGKEVELQSDFEVQGGATFHAYIQGCTN